MCVIVDVVAAVLSKVAEWKAHKEAVLSGDVTQGTEPTEEEDIYAVKEHVSILLAFLTLSALKSDTLL